ncbi:glycosyl hydrolase [Geitlerinema sp. PCC 9228]|uniref:glycosyl hydrolase n=1 Tax=Geitlerinema sp. PCC 9228 TaxID=111611 RepID=UPI0008F9CEBF|nr:glycosyl hydrolase [Geitlerinema sp. PCC 9228]
MTEPTNHTTQQPGLILGPGPSQWWDSERVSCPRVLRCSDGMWRMWYYGRDRNFDRDINLPTGHCGMAISEDGIHWQRVQGPLTMGAVFEPHPDPNRFDSAHVGVSDVRYSDGYYWMWYFGGDNNFTQVGNMRAKGVRMQPGCAISGDGLHWVRLEGPHRGAFLPVGESGDFDELFCGFPQVLRENDGSWKLYYHTLHPEKGFLVGLAVSKDGLHWEKVGQVLGPGAAGRFDERGAGTRYVLPIDNQYVMFYEGVNNSGYHCIGIATSTDGQHWQKQDGDEVGGAVFAHAQPGSGRWDARAVGTPCVVPLENGGWYMYYIGANEGGTDELTTQHQIGLAVSDGNNFAKWKRWGE